MDINKVIYNKIRDRILRKNPELALGVRFTRTTGSTSRRNLGFIIFIMLLLAMIFFILEIYFWNNTEYSTQDIGGGGLKLPYYPLRRFAVPFWIMAFMFAIEGNLLALKGK